MGKPVLERYRQRFEALKSGFNRRPILVSEMGGPRSRKAVVLEEMRALLEKVEALGENGQALQREIEEFLEMHQDGYSLSGNNALGSRQGESGKSLRKWIDIRAGDSNPAPSKERKDRARLSARMPKK